MIQSVNVLMEYPNGAPPAGNGGKGWIVAGAPQLGAWYGEPQIVIHVLDVWMPPLLMTVARSPLRSSAGLDVRTVARDCAAKPVTTASAANDIARAIESRFIPT